MKMLLRVCVAALTTTFALAAHAQEVTFRVQHFWPAQAIPPTQVLQPWCDRIAADSNKRMKCQIFPTMQLGGQPSQLIDQVRDGVIDIGFTLPGYTANRFPIMDALELPLLSRSAEATSMAAWEFYEKYAQKEFSAVKPLMFAVHEPGYIHTRNKRITALADFRGLKLRTATRRMARLVEAVGASPVAMPQSAVFDSVNKGVIDGVLLPWEPISALRLQEVLNNHTETPTDRPALFTHLFVIAMNKARYDGLPAELKGVIDRNSGAGFSKSAGKVWDSFGSLSRKVAEKRGNSFYTLPAAEMDQWEKVVSPLREEWVASMNSAGMRGEQMLDDLRAMIAKHSKE